MLDALKASFVKIAPSDWVASAHFCQGGLALKRVDERRLQNDFFTQAAGRLQATLDESDQILLPLEQVQLLKGLVNSLVDLAGFLTLFDLLGELLTDLNNFVLDVTFQLFFFLLEFVTELQVLFQGDSELASQVFDILRRLLMLHISEI